MSDQENHGLFEGKWGSFDETAAFQFRQGLQACVDSMNTEGQQEFGVSTTVIVHMRNTSTGSYINRMSPGIEDRDELRRAIDSCIDERVILPKPIEQVIAGAGKFTGEAIKKIFGFDS